MKTLISDDEDAALSEILGEDTEILPEPPVAEMLGGKPARGKRDVEPARGKRDVKPEASPKPEEPKPARGKRDVPAAGRTVERSDNAPPLAGFRERILHLEEWKKTIADDIKEVYAEAKGSGYDTKILRMAIKQSQIDRALLAEERSVLDRYLDAFR
jgi:uncharacterized protein (UPF0335 family)